jgi:hypothetical protein
VIKIKTSESQLARRFWRGHFRSDSVNYVKEMPKWRTEKKKNAEGPCQIRVASGLGFLGQGQSGVRSCSLVGSWGMTPAQQGGENDPLTRRVVDPREGSLNLPQGTVGVPLERFASRFGLSPRVRQHLLH